MKFGCCAAIEYSEHVRQAGFDFMECTVVSLVPEKGKYEFAEIFRKYKESPLPVEACNVLLPGDMRIVGEQVNEDRIKSYLECALDRVQQIGAQLVVFGSGRARSIPTGFAREKGEEQILHFLELAADYAQPLGITIVIEPLNKKESNIINTVEEAQMYAEKVNRTSIQVLADFYHMMEENELLNHLITAKKYLHHIHVADTGRTAPGQGSYPYADFVKTLKAANYNERVSIECGWGHFEDEIVNAREFLRRQFGE